MLNIRHIIAYLLYPISIGYTLVVWVRNYCFDKGLLRMQRPGIPTIGVGNLSCGGTGKTPHVEYLVRMLQSRYKPALLSRGYKRKTKGFVLATPQTTVQEVGDEPYQMAQKFPDATVAVCENRNMGITQLLLENPPPDMVILDDVFQHRYVKPDISILLTEFDRPFYSDRVLPFGNLREPRLGYQRADIIVVTKSPAQLSQKQIDFVLHKIHPNPSQYVFFSSIEYGTPLSLDGTQVQDLATVDHILIVAGIANPEPLVQKLSQTSQTLLCQFPDHHEFNRDDIHRITTLFQSMSGSNNIIITTEKDSVRLKASPYQVLISQLPIFYIPISIIFHKTSELSFDETISLLLNSSVTNTNL